MDLVIHNKPLGGGADENLAKIALGLKEAGLAVSQTEIKAKLNEYWDLEGLAKLDDEDQESDEEPDQERHVTIDEGKNEVKEELPAPPLTRSQVRKQKDPSPEAPKRSTRRSSRAGEATTTPPVDESSTEDTRPKRTRAAKDSSTTATAPTPPAATTPKKRGRTAPTSPDTTIKSEEDGDNEESVAESPESSPERPKRGRRASRAAPQTVSTSPKRPKRKTAPKPKQKELPPRSARRK